MPIIIDQIEFLKIFSIGLLIGSFFGYILGKKQKIKCYVIHDLKELNANNEFKK